MQAIKELAAYWRAEPMNQKDDWQKWYRTLKAVEPEAYEKALRYAEGLSLQFNLPLSHASEIERSHVMLACELLGVRP